MAGYSGTPLIKKLGINDGYRLLFVDAPANFSHLLGPLPSRAEISRDATAPVDLVVLFVESKSRLEAQFTELTARLAPAGMLWNAWPKKSSGVSTDLDFGAVQSIGLASGLVDTKVCAIDDTWSGLRFVARVKDRPRASKPA